MSDLAAEVRRLAKKVDDLSAIIVPVFTRKVSQREMARRAGVHPSTISRRKRKARITSILGGKAA